MEVARLTIELTGYIALLDITWTMRNAITLMVYSSPDPAIVLITLVKALVRFAYGLFNESSCLLFSWFTVHIFQTSNPSFVHRPISDI